MNLGELHRREYGRILASLIRVVKDFDQAICDGKIPPVIIAAPDGAMKGRPTYIHLATFFANQAAAALENARLYEQTHEYAVVEERNRLARELHDAMTQTRSYRAHLGRNEAVAELLRSSPSQFDPDLVMAFLTILTGNRS